MIMIIEWDRLVNLKTVPEKSLSTWNLKQSNCSTEDASSSAALIPTALHCPSQLSLIQPFESSFFLKTLLKIYILRYLPRGWDSYFESRCGFGTQLVHQKHLLKCNFLVDMYFLSRKVPSLYMSIPATCSIEKMLSCQISIRAARMLDHRPATIETRPMKNANRICLTSDGFGIVNFKSFFDFPPPGSKIKYQGSVDGLGTPSLSEASPGLLIYCKNLFYPYMSNWKMNVIWILIWSDHEKN